MTAAHDDSYYRDTVAALEAAYLAGDNPRAQSGFGGDEPYWERSRRVCIDAVDGDGSYLDIGCASGYLMESIERWAAAAGHAVAAHGLDLSAPLVELARARLPHLAARIHHGNVMTWVPEQRFTYVRTELVYVPPRRRAELVARLFSDYLEPGGRAIICSYGSSRDPANRAEPVASQLAEWGFVAAGTGRAVAANGVVVAHVAWVEAP